MKKVLIFIVFLSFCVYSYGAKVSPVKFNLEITKGSTEKYALSIIGSRDGSLKQDLIISTSDLWMSKSGALLFDRKIGSTHSAVDWIKFDNTEITAVKDKIVKANFRISVPYDATPGEYYSIIFVEPKVGEIVKIDRGKNVDFKAVVGVLVIINVPGRSYQKTGRVVEDSVVVDDKFISIKSSYQNTGNIHQNVLAEAVIKSADGKTVFGKYSLKGAGSSLTEVGDYFIFPDSTILDFECKFDNLLPNGDYIVETSYDYGYSYRKARGSQKFSVSRKTSLNEENQEFVLLGDKDLILNLPENGRSSKIVKLSNIDYRPIGVKIESNDWVKISPSIISLKSGESKNVMVVVNPKYEGKIKKECSIIFETDRGKDLTLKILSNNKK